MNLTIRRLATAGAVAALATLGAMAVVGPASAGERPKTSCVAQTHTTTEGITLVGEATATVAEDGVMLTTGLTSDADKATWRFTLPEPLDSDKVAVASYTTTKLDEAGPGVSDAALPSFHIFVQVDGKPGVLIYEPYWNLTPTGPGMDAVAGNPVRNVEQSWSVLNGKFWTSSANTFSGLPKTAGGPASRTWGEINSANPSMKITGFGFGLGTYNRGVKALVNDMLLAGRGGCHVHFWTTPQPTPTATVTTAPPTTAPPVTTAPATTAPATTAPATTGPPPTTGPAATLPPPTSTSLPAGEPTVEPTTGGRLALTGEGTGFNPVGLLIPVGVVLVILGAFLLLRSKRRN